jgi:hypothetical protein
MLIQDEAYEAPDLGDCEAWIASYGLTNVVLIDPEQLVQVHIPGTVLPTQLIVDADGVIRSRHVGDDIDELRMGLDALLDGH